MVYDFIEDEEETQDSKPYDSIARPSAQINEDDSDVFASASAPVQASGEADPLLNQFNKDNEVARAIRQRVSRQNADTNMYKAMAQIATAASPGVKQSDVFDSVIKQNNLDAAYEQSDLKNRAAVMRAIQASKDRAAGLSAANAFKEKSLAESERHNRAMEKEKSDARTLEKSPKPDQFKAGTFAKRIEQAEAVLNELDESGFNPSSVGTGVQSGSFLGMSVPERFKSQEVKKYNQAKDNFINATLRRESGASISPQERESADRQYFALPGDTEEILAQKRENRRIVFEGLKAESGNAFEKIPVGQTRIATSDGLDPMAQTDRPQNVNVEAPDGKVRSIPLSDLKAALAAGGKLVK